MRLDTRYWIRDARYAYDEEALDFSDSTIEYHVSRNEHRRVNHSILEYLSNFIDLEAILC